MPENNPLHTEMSVREYLKFRGRLKGLDRSQSRNRSDVVMEQCGLKEVSTRIIAHLSKGFRQRVGLAEAMIHEPDLLILDEPTIGLDPNQIRQVRELIKSLGERHTILLSTHILSEVEATCSRVIIINRGRIEASDTPENLVNQLRTSGLLHLEVKSGPEDPVPHLAEVSGVREVRAVSDGEWRSFEIRIEANSDPREQI